MPIMAPEKDFDHKTIEEHVWKIWAEKDAYKKTKEKFSTYPDYYFVDGPPYTSGNIHMGTAWNKILKDVVIRNKRMHGFNVRDQPGYDMHGLPIEVKVEKELGMKNKQSIEEYGVSNFINKCKEFAFRFKDNMTGQFKKLGVWMDWDNPYMTLKNEYIESAWWTIKKGHEKGLLNLDQRVLSWCPRCQTALAEAEVEYWDETDPSIYVRFKVKEGEDNEYIIIWTTTPWTLPADLAVAVNPNFTYVRAKVRSTEDGHEEIWWLFKDRLSDVCEISGFEEVEILEEKLGEDMEGMEYIHPLLEEVPFHQREDKGYWWHKVVLADYVLEDNTGCVHTAPGHGPDDFATGVRYDIPPFCPVDEAGNFTEEAGKYAGQNTIESNKQIIDELYAKGLMLYDTTITHRFGHCWRCKTPITYRTTKQWFMGITKVRDLMLDEIDKVSWYPEWGGKNRFRDWVENTRDWCITRQRYWGIPLPIWRCDCGEIKVIESRRDLKEQAVSGYEDGMDLHRPWVDNVVLKCDKCGGEMHRVPDVLDVWFDSAVSSWAQLDFPATDEQFKRWWPMKWICEAHDQTRGWFYSQLGASVVAFDRSPYEEVLIHGFALDRDGRPMSKSLGNSVDPLEIGEKYGMDAMRWYLLITSAPWEDLAFNEEGVSIARRSLNILWNSLWFSTTYMALDNFDPGKYNLKDLKDALKPEDRWMLSRINTTQKLFDEYFSRYEIHKALREIESFITDDLSRWYIKLVRYRTWEEGIDDDKAALYMTLYYVLHRLAKLLAPVIPFTAEMIYEAIDGREDTVAMELWPEVEEDLIDEELERNMDTLKKVYEAATYARQIAGIKLRWPVHNIVIDTADKSIAIAVKSLKSILMEQLNAKDISVIDKDTNFEGLITEIEPDYSALGPVFKGDAKKVGEAILEANPDEVMKELSENGSYTIGEWEIKPDMIKTREVVSEGWAMAKFPGGRVFSPKEIPIELKKEGMARELIRRIQDMRKQADLDLEDYIDTSIQLPDELEKMVESWLDHIASETRSKTLKLGSAAGDHVVDWKIEGMDVKIGIKKA